MNKCDSKSNDISTYQRPRELWQFVLLTVGLLIGIFLYNTLIDIVGPVSSFRILISNCVFFVFVSVLIYGVTPKIYEALENMSEKYRFLGKYVNRLLYSCFFMIGIIAGGGISFFDILDELNLAFQSIP